MAISWQQASAAGVLLMRNQPLLKAGATPPPWKNRRGCFDAKRAALRKDVNMVTGEMMTVGSVVRRLNPQWALP